MNPLNNGHDRTSAIVIVPSYFYANHSMFSFYRLNLSHVRSIEIYFPGNLENFIVCYLDR